MCWGTSFVLSVMLAVGCGSGSDGSLREHLEEGCRHFHECRASYSGPFAFETLYGADTESCIAVYSSVADSIEASIAAGRTEYDSALAASCASRRRALAGEALWTTDELDDCAATLVGTQPDASACELDTECASGMCSADCVDGTCSQAACTSR